MSARRLQGCKNIVSSFNAIRNHLYCVHELWFSTGIQIPCYILWECKMSVTLLNFVLIFCPCVNLNAGPKQVPENALLAQAAQWPGCDLAVTQCHLSNDTLLYGLFFFSFFNCPTQHYLCCKMYPLKKESRKLAF